jgi:hypothetical protein
MKQIILAMVLLISLVPNLSFASSEYTYGDIDFEIAGAGPGPPVTPPPGGGGGGGKWKGATPGMINETVCGDHVLSSGEDCVTCLEDTVYWLGEEHCRIELEKIEEEEKKKGGDLLSIGAAKVSEIVGEDPYAWSILIFAIFAIFVTYRYYEGPKQTEITRRKIELRSIARNRTRKFRRSWRR